MNNKNKVSTKWVIFGCQMFGVAVLVTVATVGSAFAETITKTFEFGAGSAHLQSAFRTFPVPCRKAVAVTVKFKRLGTAGVNNDIPILIELREPNTAPDQEGPIVGEIRSATSRTSEQTVTLTFSGPAINRGCSLPWRVRVRHANEGTAPFVTTGSIKLDFDGGVRNINFPEGHNIRKGGSESLTVNLGSTGGLEEGTIQLKGDWSHNLLNLAGIVTGPNPIKLRFTLIDPNGEEVKTAEGYADRQRERNLGLPILKLTYRVTNCTPGQWKLKITNLDLNDDVSFDSINETFTPDCP